jgi:hypothetical protein
VARTVTVDPGRLEHWLAGFAARHGPTASQLDAELVTLRAEDGAEARIRVPFPPLRGERLADLVEHVCRDRTVAALLVRRGGVAVGVFRGRELLSSKIETSYVQGKTKAGGWSQQRYARRRENQARKLTEVAAELTVTLVLPKLGELDALAGGGDRSSVDAVLADPRLRDLGPLRLERTYPVPDPRLSVLHDFPELFLAVEIELNELA